MRIQTRLFLGTAALVLALMAVQWWLHARQLRAIESELGGIATSVGKEILSGETAFFGPSIAPGDKGLPNIVGVDIDSTDAIAEIAQPPVPGKLDAHVQVVVVPKKAGPQVSQRIGRSVVRHGSTLEGGEVVEETIDWVVEADDMEFVGENEPAGAGHEAAEAPGVRRLVLRVEDGTVREERFLVVSEDEHPLHRIPIPVAPTIERIQGTMRRGVAVGGLLLVAGLFASAVLSRRLTRPLRMLAEGAEAVGRGDLGVQVPVSASGEVGDLQRSFNRMSERLAELEAERDRWQQREHLAQLGDLSRGLAHTLRNPLHTLGLAVEELAGGEGDRQSLVATSRAQIRRIDRWLRSFLALGAEEVAEPVAIDLGDLVQAVALESVQQGAEVRIESADETLVARVVPGALRAALANLVENATDASPEGEPVLVRIAREDEEALVTVTDSGPGLPDEVRRRLFSPHVTTKVGGSGMGLFLARQLVVGMHGGRLEVSDRNGGGTVASVYLPLVDGDIEKGERESG